MRSRWVALALTAATMLGISHPVWAADDKEREADAERFFREGQKLLEERRYAEACPKFQSAYEKDGKLGTLTNLAFCHKAQGANWFAWLEFREAELKAVDQKRNDRREFAREQRVELEKTLPRVVLDNPQKLALVELRIEDRKVPEAEHLAPFTAEQGQRKFLFKAKGKKSATVLVSVAAGTKLQHVPVPDMDDGSDEPPPPPVVALPDKVVEAPAAKESVRPDDAGKTQRTVGYVAFGAAGVFFVVGSVTGVVAVTGKCSDNFLHPKKSACTQGDADTSHTFATVATITFIGAGVAALAGITLLATAPSSKPKTGLVVHPEVGLGWAGLRGTF